MPGRNVAFLPVVPIAPKAITINPAGSRHPCMCHAATNVPRRTFVRFAALTIAAGMLPSQSHALSLAEKGVEKHVQQVSLSLEKAKSLLATVNTFKQTLAEDDADFVLRYAAIWLEPGRVAMKQISEQTAVPLADLDKITNIAAATLGHLLELRMELQARQRDRVARELDEYIESAADLLSLPSVKRFIK
ncbi:hypothetical protein FGB62_44g145 [Gracilaria domingensis]|nr:hypothetical protein FGB62_44g145 [Gracilaria domingensis]